ncbi:MAG: hypothetical protein R8G66_25590 [Cytophagales bacterium]|nr:hypothetical protein [Cytophagales bacterium]
MKKSNNPQMEDQELQQFFDELKTEEVTIPIPEIDELIPSPQEKSGSTPFWRYAAVIALLMIGLATYQWGFISQESEADITEIIISYEFPTAEELTEKDELELPGMDQWRSETDILLTGL